MAPRGIDHIVHAVNDLDAAGEFYARIGFTVGARNAHPWGTHNRIVQFPGCFIELLTVAEPAKIVPPAPGRFSFGAFNQNFLARGEGFSMLVLESQDAEADAAAFRTAGVGDFAPFHFERAARRPDGAEVKVAFTLAFAKPEACAGFFVCQQHYPENFWNPAFQNHPNGALGVAGVMLTADEPAQHRAFLAAFAAVDEVAAVNGGIGVRTPRGIIDIMEPAAARARFGAERAAREGGLAISALRIDVPDLNGLRARLSDADVPASLTATGVVVPAQAAFGAILAFESRVPPLVNAKSRIFRTS
jgi:hypothetical protein